MKIWKWLLGAVIICIGGLLIYSLFNQEPGPVSDKSVTEQTDQQSELIDQADPFSEESQSTTDMVEGTVGY